MKKLLLKIVLALWLILTFTQCLFAQESNNYYEISKEVVNIRAEPTTKSDVVCQLKQNDVVEVINFTDDWAYITFEDSYGEEKQGYVKSELISKQIISSSNNIEQEETSDYTGIKRTLIGLLIISFICYVIAMVKARKGTMVVIANWYDFALLVSPLVLFIIAGIFAMFDKNTAALVFFIIGLLSFCGSMVYSIIANKGNFFNMIISIFAKVFVLLISIIVLEYVFRGKNKDNNWYDDMKHDARTVAAIGIAGFLIFSLVHNGNHEELVEELQSKV